MPLLETSKKQERQDYSETTSVRLDKDERDMDIWRMAYHGCKIWYGHYGHGHTYNFIWP